MFTEKEFSLLYDGLECMKTLPTYESYRKEHELLVEKIKKLEKERFDMVSYFYSVRGSDECGNVSTISGWIEVAKSVVNFVKPSYLTEELYKNLNSQYPNKNWVLISFNKV